MPFPLLRTLAVVVVASTMSTNSVPTSSAPTAAARRWNATGHEVIASIAWSHLTPTAKARAVALLRAGPGQAHLTDSDVGTTPAERDRNLFVMTSVWADVIKNRQIPSHVYDRGNWHYADFFWKEQDGKPVALPDMGPDKENALESLRVMQELLAGNAPDTSKAVALAWIEHLTGDVHQPLHLSARVTPDGPKGDRGGNDFKLGGNPSNLHAYWDGVLDLVEPHGDDLAGAVQKWATTIEQKLPMTGFSAAELDATPEVWGRESLAIAEKELYPATLALGDRPSDAYRNNAAQVTERRMALAGYRMARLLNRVLK